MKKKDLRAKIKELGSFIELANVFNITINEEEIEALSGKKKVEDIK